MTLEELKALVEAMKDESDVQAFIEKLSVVSEDAAREYMTTDAGRTLLPGLVTDDTLSAILNTAPVKSEVDRRVGQGIQTYQDGQVDKEKASIAQQVTEQVAALNKQPEPWEAKQIALQQEIEKITAERERDKLLRQATEYAAENKVDTWFLNEFHGKTLAEFQAQIQRMKDHDEKRDAATEKRVREEMLSKSGKPGASGGNGKLKEGDITMEQFKAMSPADRTAFIDEFGDGDGVKAMDRIQQ